MAKLLWHCRRGPLKRAVAKVLKSDDSALRVAVESGLAEQRWTAAELALRSLWRERPSGATARFVIQSFEQLRPVVDFKKCRLKVLRSFTLEPVMPLLRAAAFTHRLDVTVDFGNVNAYTQEILDAASDLYTTPWDVVVLAIHTRDAAPVLWNGAGEDEQVDFAAKADAIANHFRELISQFRSRSNSALVVHTLETPAYPTSGALDHQSDNGQIWATRRINDALHAIAREQSGVYVLDYDGIAARFGRDRWTDERMWLTAKLPFGPAGLIPMAEEWLRYLCPLSGRSCKVLVTDLDNTLWGGVIGEDGIEGLKLDTEYPGAAFVEVQRSLLSLRKRGILLAICSKNNREDALPVLENHPNMLLRPAHFAAEFINWVDKPQNLRDIAKQLNVGLDSLAFLDDNHAERDRVRAELPEVTVLEVSKDPLSYAAVVRDAPELQRLELSKEDQERGRMYAERRQRIEAEQNYANVEAFYHSLGQEVEIGPLSNSHLTRIAQLTQKTNQFNATTKRYNEQELTQLASQPGCGVFWARSQDKFGDNGLIGVMIARLIGEACEIDTFLLSCRVLSRGIETAMLAFLADQCSGKGIRRLEGWIVPTAKNEPVRTLYERHGFALHGSDGERTKWSIELDKTAILCPEWIKMRSHDQQFAGEYVAR
jgi:FkbH-like protein